MNQLKRQVLPSGLWVVATPIGNLADLSPRARQALEEADFIVCEDTRRTAKLLAALGVGSAMPRLKRHDAHSGEREIGELVGLLEEGRSIALVSDAGTPAVSDPGSALVAAAAAHGIVVTPIAGPSAVVTFLSACGFGETAFAFRGFFPRKRAEQEQELKACLGSPAQGVWIWFESPERIVAALECVASEAADAHVVAAKELTKLHEKFFRGDAGEVLGQVREECAREGVRGEWVFALALSSQSLNKISQAGESSEWVKALECLLDAGVASSAAAKQVSRHFDVPKNQVYDRALKISGKKV